jgi:hypothetical protein
MTEELDKLPGTVTLEWACSQCGALRRTKCTDITGAVYAFRPAGWTLGGGMATCNGCTPSTAEGRKQQENHSAMMRDRLSGLRAGGAAAEDQPDYGIRQAPIPVASGGAGANGPQILRDSEGKPLAVIGPGGASGQGIPGTYHTGGAGRGGGPGSWEAATIHAPDVTVEETRVMPPRMEGEPMPNPTPGPNGPKPVNPGPVQQATPATEIHTRDFRPGGGNVVFQDTRDSEFLGPQKIEAGVPSVGSKVCIGCRHEINDGTVSGVAEAWRWAVNPENGHERGHTDCLARIGR